jgi:hypothetical protein
LIPKHVGSLAYGYRTGLGESSIPPICILLSTRATTIYHLDRRTPIKVCSFSLNFVTVDLELNPVTPAVGRGHLKVGPTYFVDQLLKGDIYRVSKELSIQGGAPNLCSL